MKFNVDKNIKDFEFGLYKPINSQEKVLRRILQENKTTEYGKKYKFNRIKTIEEFQKKVPIITYPDIKEYIEKIKNGEKKILTKKDVTYFAVTSGTTSEPKYIPVTRERIRTFKKEFLTWGFYVLSKYFNVLKGKTLYFAGTDICGITNGGIEYGNISGYLARVTPWYLKKKMALPLEIYRIKNYELRTKKIAKLSLKSKITQIGFAEPIEAILFFDYLKKNKKNLIQELKKEGLRKRAQYLESLKEFTPAKIWPSLELISCIKNHMHGLYLNKLKEKLGKEITIRDPGIYSSEGRITLCITADDTAGICPITINFFEFKDMNTEKIHTIDELEENKEYQVIITTPEGLYRYNIEDIVKVVGFKRKLPLLEFVSRSKFIDLSGEKCPETEVIDAFRESFKDVENFTIIPNIDNLDKRPKYEVLAEFKKKKSKHEQQNMLEKFDTILQKKVLDYANMRNEYGRLDPPILTIVAPGSYKQWEEKRIVKSGQPKNIHVSQDPSIKKHLIYN